uniref:Ig-like domain-containing protein n=1 Tax=Sphaeramia orbicularis TaxID=375764 RepID=A0A673BSP0_9TELE
MESTATWPNRFMFLTATPQGLRVRQYPPSLSVMRGETATLSCHFEVESPKYGVQWFRMKSVKELIPKSSRESVVEKNQTSYLVITEVALEDSGWYYCEVNVLQEDPEWGNGTELPWLADVAMLVIVSHFTGVDHASP